MNSNNNNMQANIFVVKSYKWKFSVTCVARIYNFHYLCILGKMFIVDYSLIIIIKT